MLVMPVISYLKVTNQSISALIAGSIALGRQMIVKPPNMSQDLWRLTMNEFNREWEFLTPEEKKKQLFLKQKKTLETFLERNAISKAQYEKSLGDLIDKMGMQGVE